MLPTAFQKPWILWTSGTVLVLVTAVMLWRHIEAEARQEYEAAKAAFAAHGFPTRMDEILPTPIADGDNADPLLRDAWEIAAGARDFSRGSRLQPLEELAMLALPSMAENGIDRLLPPEELEKAARLLREPDVTRFLHLVREATRRPAFRRDQARHPSPDSLLPPVGPLREMVRSLAKDCLVAGFLDDDPIRAWADVDAMFTLADWADDEPFLIPYLTGLACRGIANQSAFDLLAHNVPPSEPKRYLALIEKHLASLDLERAYHGERLGMASLAENQLLSEPDWLHGITLWAEAPAWIEWCDPWLTPFLSSLARPRLYQELRVCHEHHLAVAMALRSQDARIPDRLKQLESAISSHRGFLAPFVLPNTSGITRMHLISVTDLRQLLVVLAAFQYQRDHNVWPNDLAQLALSADHTVDATCDRPMRLRRDTSSIFVYGFGTDGDDDGGKPMPRGDYATGNGDIVVRVNIH